MRATGYPTYEQLAAIFPEWWRKLVYWGKGEANRPTKEKIISIVFVADIVSIPCRSLWEFL